MCAFILVPVDRELTEEETTTADKLKCVKIKSVFAESIELDEMIEIIGTLYEMQGVSKVGLVLTSFKMCHWQCSGHSHRTCQGCV